MSCKSLIYASNTGSQSIAVGGNINFGSVVRKTGCNCYMSGGNVIVRGEGYYKIDTNITFTAGASGTATIALYKDGIAIPGAVVSLTATADNIYSVGSTAIIRELCCNESTVTAVVSGIAVTVTNAAIEVNKV